MIVVSDGGRVTCGYEPPNLGYAPCTRPRNHTGPCAHPERTEADQWKRFHEWLDGERRKHAETLRAERQRRSLWTVAALVILFGIAAVVFARVVH